MASPTHHEPDEHAGHDDVPSTLHLGSQNADFGLLSVQLLPVPLHINKVIVGELQNVLASMKLNSRWKDISRAVRNALNQVLTLFYIFEMKSVLFSILTILYLSCLWKLL